MVDPIDTKQTRKFFEETIELYPDAKDEPEYDAIFALCNEVDRLRAELEAEREKQDKCQTCGGEGERLVHAEFSKFKVPCYVCFGTGKVTK